jgi:alpha-tubulin suppressor-like RCC1 family protein
VLLLALFPFCPTLYAQDSSPIHYVNVSNATPVAPFTNWATAAISIQDAILFANAGDTVLVTNGVYATGGQTASGGLITNRVSIDRPITVQSLNGPEVTIIVGNGPLGDSAVRCVYLTNGAVLSGFTLANGATRDSGDISTAIDTCGGGVLCESINALVTNCTLTGNSAGVEWWSSWEGGNGGGAYGGTLNNCTLTGNHAGKTYAFIGYGGGVYGATLNNCTLTGNYAGGTDDEDEGGGVGGGAYSCTLNNCTLTSNGSWWNGGGAYSSTLSNCTLTGNYTYEYGGGAYYGTLYNCTLTGNSAGIGGGVAYASVNNCTLSGNSAYPYHGGAYGGGAYSCTLNNCTLTGNSAPEFGQRSYGGGAYGGTLNNCTLTGNWAYDHGGGAYGGTLNNCTLTGNYTYGCGGGADSCSLNNCTLTGNRAREDTGGGAYYGTLYNCTLTGNSAWNGGGVAYASVNNCTLTGNSASSYGGGAYGGTLTNCIVFYNTAPTNANCSGSTFNYCCTTPLPLGPGNISSDPMFVNVASNDYHLLPSSPCVNAGTNQDWMTNATDLDGNPRIICGVVDMGAYELNMVCTVLITSQPTNQTVAAGGNSTFTVVAVGSPPLNYQWFFGTSPVTGGTGSSLVFSNVQPSQGGSYSVVVSNAYGSIASSNALLTVPTPPTISQQPVGQTLCAGGSWTFQVVGSGSPAPGYQWRLNGTNISGATASSYSVSGATSAQAGPYDVVVSNPCGSVTSSIALLAVALPGSVVAWGDNTYGQCNIPWGLTNVASIAPGVYHSLALKMDGTVVGWGQNDFDQTNPSGGLSNVTAIAAGWGTSFALKGDGTLEEWGWEDYGLRATAEALTNIISVSALWDCGMALKSDNTVFVWGKSTHGETNVPAGLTDVVAVSGGGYFCMALKRDGTVVAWGSNAYGQTNTPPNLSGVTAIAAGGDHCLALKSDGTVVAWGYNNYGQTDVPPDLTNAVAVSAGAYHSLALRADGTLVAWGLGSSGQTNIPACLHSVAAISAGGYHNLALVAGSYPMQLWDVNCLPGGQVQLKVSGLPGDVFRVLASTNLLDWQVIGFVTNYCDSVQFNDTQATNFNRRFYRLVTP